MEIIRATCRWELPFVRDMEGSEGEPGRVIPGLVARSCPFSDMQTDGGDIRVDAAEGLHFLVQVMPFPTSTNALTSIPPLRSIWIHKGRLPRLASSQRGSLDDRAAGWLPCLVLVLMLVLEAGRMFLFLASTGYRVQTCRNRSEAIKST